MIVYSIDPQAFLLSRSALCGSKNFVSLGKVILGNYDDVSKVISSSQVRGPYLGRGRLREDRITPFYLLGLSDPGTDTIDGQSGIHKVLHKFIAKLMLQAQTNAAANDEIRLNLQEQITHIIDSVMALGIDTDYGRKDSNILKDLCQRFICQYMMKAILDIDVDEEFIDLLQRLFLAPGTFLKSIVEPAASLLVTERQAIQARNDFDTISSMIHNSPGLEDYISSPENFNFTKTEFAVELTMLMGIAGINGGFNLVWNMFTQIPEDILGSNTIDYTQHMELGNAVLEATRMRSPVNNVNVVLPEDTILNVGGSEKVFPKGTIVASSIGLASFDDVRFQDPFVFNHTRPNLRHDILNFNSQGIDADVTSSHVCPGKNIAYKLGMDVLRTWLKRREDQQCETAGTECKFPCADCCGGNYKCPWFGLFGCACE